MGGSGAGGTCPSACGLLLLLLLLWGAVTTALPLEGSPAGQDSTHTQEVAKMKRNELLTFLAWWHEWAAQAGAGALVGGDVSEASKRQEDPRPPQPPRRETTPCKNFFWKTFSSCK